MRQVKGSGDPKPLKEKLDSQKNVSSHGLTSLAPCNTNEEAPVDSSTQERRLSQGIGELLA